MVISTKLKLTASEESLRAILVAFSTEFGKMNPQGPVVVRFTGGWVRDKLLQRQSHDIDVAIDKATGEQFATALRDYLIRENSGVDVSMVHTISSNPAKSKHLETATTRLNGLDIDFVNLRSEEYTSESRIPIMKFGTPKEDALRRDATLNALFYNLQLNEVEDFTGRGLEDLANGILRTPLDPLTTFNDDPLRILRLIRFAGQFDFDLAPDTEKAMENPSIREQLLVKVSRERIGVEIQKLAESPNVLKGLRYIARLGLAPYIFSIPEEIANGKLALQWTKIKPQISWSNLGRNLEAASQIIPKVTGSILPADLSLEDKGSLWLSLCLQNTGDLQLGKEMLSSIIVKDGIKLSRKIAQSVTRIITASNHLPDPATASRSELGLFVRECGPDWRLVLSHSACVSNDTSRASALLNAIERMSLETAYDLKPALDGKEVMALFAGRKMGPWLKQILDSQIIFQLDNPDASRSEVEAYLKSLEH